LSVTEKVKDWGYDIKSSWLVFATWLGDSDILVFDIEKYINGVIALSLEVDLEM